MFTKTFLIVVSQVLTATLLVIMVYDYISSENRFLVNLEGIYEETHIKYELTLKNQSDHWI